MSIYKKLSKVQGELRAPKGQFNKFGNYNYRSAEDILEALKPLLVDNGLVLTITDEIVLVGDRYYVKATATVIDVDEPKVNAEVTAYAREEENKKGMDGSQITGAASSYARKYALNGLFCIDDTKDSDATNTHDKEEPQGPTTQRKTTTEKNNLLNEINTLLEQKDVTLETILKFNRKNSLEELTEQQMKNAINFLNNAKSKAS